MSYTLIMLRIISLLQQGKCYINLYRKNNSLKIILMKYQIPMPKRTCSAMFHVDNDDLVLKRTIKNELL